MTEYIERTIIEGHFRTKVTALKWVEEKRADGFEINGPFNNGGFAFSHEHPWEVKASFSASVETEGANI